MTELDGPIKSIELPNFTEALGCMSVMAGIIYRTLINFLKRLLMP